MILQPIVEGHGEVEALPVLLRRLRDLAQVFSLEVSPPIRRHYTDFFEEQRVRKAVQIALKQECDAILLMVDGDGDHDCPREQGPQILGWAQAEAAGKPCAVVMAFREYESWFLASIESLRGKRGIRADAVSHPDPEEPRGAKERLEERMEDGRSYSETADQPALSAQFEMQPTYEKCRSFRHLVKVFGELATAGGLAPAIAWPPAEWVAGGGR
jgi:Domain of unknown function (DUF4276)